MPTVGKEAAVSAAEGRGGWGWATYKLLLAIQRSDRSTSTSLHPRSSSGGQASPRCAEPCSPERKNVCSTWCESEVEHTNATILDLLERKRPSSSSLSSFSLLIDKAQFLCCPRSFQGLEVSPSPVPSSSFLVSGEVSVRERPPPPPRLVSGSEIHHGVLHTRF